MKTLIIGASNKKQRYSYKAFCRLREKGYEVVLSHPKIKSIDGVEVFGNLKDINQKIDTVTLYVNKGISSKMSDDILSLKPRRIIFNPGTENEELKRKAEEAEIECVYGCTLVMLASGQY